MTKKKKVLLAWSGGLDSTFLVWDYLQRGWDVDVVYGELMNNETKVVREVKATDAMFESWFSRYSVKRVNTVGINLGNFSKAAALTQVPAWILTLISSIDETHDEVALGYVLNDDAVSFIDDIKALWNGYRGLMVFDLPPIVFPLIKISKIRIYNALPEELRSKVTWCENTGEKDRCGHCTPCRKMISLGLQDAHTYGEPETETEAKASTVKRRKKNKPAALTKKKE